MLNQSKCRLEGWLRCTQGTIYFMGALIPLWEWTIFACYPPHWSLIRMGSFCCGVCKNGWTIWDAVWGADACYLNEPCGVDSWAARSDESICCCEGWQDGDAAEFSLSLTAKLYCRSWKVSKVKNWCIPPCHHAEYGAATLHTNFGSDQWSGGHMIPKV